MERQSTMNAGKIVLGAAAGIAAGAILGVLFAPDKGSEIRKRISTQGSRYIDRFKNAAREYVDTFAEKFENARETVAHVVDHPEDEVGTPAVNQAKKPPRQS